MKKIAFVLASTLALACSAEGEDEFIETEEAREAEIEEITENLLAAGYTEEDIEVIEMDGPVSVAGVPVFDDGPQVLLQGDMLVNLETSREMAGLTNDDESFRHWITPSLVTNNNTICLLRATVLDNTQIGPPIYGALTNDMNLGVSYAAGNYNFYTSIGLTFSVRNGILDINGNVHYAPGGDAGCDFTIGIARGWTSTPGMSGPPSGGAPYPFILLSDNSGTMDDQEWEHVMTHEIGHAIGMRHSDWINRASCGGGGEAQNGALFINGTPFLTTDSVFAACLPATTNGEFRGFDVAALNAIY